MYNQLFKFATGLAAVRRTPTTLRSCVMTKDFSLSCCTQDEGRPLGLGDQTPGSNRPVRLALRVRVVSDMGKGRQERSGTYPRR
ncbi:hypothetical protein C7H09_09350 [Marinobacter fuscus]|uniref:Uncharacterized protein n=1 Tax=Marinobacter fuscus TaxID=2109942 RepID=A0A2T1KC54_9GAMM|nr:hypothetical protein C7H09_09350 [Marinobacter fuscus]